MKILRFVIPPNGPVDMPAGAKVISVAWWKQTISVWATVEDPLADLEPRNFAVEMTGMVTRPETQKHGRFIGTVLILEDGIVFHVFELVFGGAH